MFHRASQTARASRHPLQQLFLQRGPKKTTSPLAIQLGQDGEKLEENGVNGETNLVQRGFFRNFLQPYKGAVYSSQSAKAVTEAKEAKPATVSKDGLEVVLARLLKGRLTIRQKKQGEGESVAPVTVATIVEAVAKQKRVSIVQQLVQLQSPLMRGGQYDVPLRIIQGNGNPAVLNVQVVAV